MSQELVTLFKILPSLRRNNLGKYLQGEQFTFFLSHKCLHLSSKIHLSPAQIAGVEARAVTLKHQCCFWMTYASKNVPYVCKRQSYWNSPSHTHKAYAMQLAHISPVVSDNGFLKCSGFLIRKHLSYWSHKGENRVPGCQSLSSGPDLAARNLGVLAKSFVSRPLLPDLKGMSTWWHELQNP